MRSSVIELYFRYVVKHYDFLVIEKNVDIFIADNIKIHLHKSSVLFIYVIKHKFNLYGLCYNKK